MESRDDENHPTMDTAKMGNKMRTNHQTGGRQGEATSVRTMPRVVDNTERKKITTNGLSLEARTE